MAGYVAFLLTWLLCVAALWLSGDHTTALLAIQIAAVCAVIATAIRITGTVDPAHDFRIKSARPALVAVAVVFILVAAGILAVSSAAAFGYLNAPGFARAGTTLLAFHTGFRLGALPIATTVLLALIPIVLLRLAGVKLAAYGLRLPEGRSRIVAAAFLVLPLAVVVVGASRGSFASTINELVANFLNNGFPEEVAARGILLSYLRAYLSTPWAIYLAGLAFALFHLPVSMAEEHWRVGLVAANVIAENLPIALAFSWMALRTRSLAPPIIVHFSFDALRHVL